MIPKGATYMRPSDMHPDWLRLKFHCFSRKLLFDFKHEPMQIRFSGGESVLVCTGCGWK